jgi:hypothetical protein
MRRLREGRRRCRTKSDWKLVKGMTDGVKPRYGHTNGLESWRIDCS